MGVSERTERFQPQTHDDDDEVERQKEQQRELLFHLFTFSTTITNRETI